MTETTTEAPSANVFSIAQKVDVHSPDSKESPGAKFLVRLQDAANEYDEDALVEAIRDFVREGNDPEDFGVNDLPSSIQDDVHEAADSAVQIYTYQVWQEFTDLCLWTEDLSDLGEVSGDDLTRDIAMRAEYLVASRGIPVLLAEKAQRLYAANPGTVTCDDCDAASEAGWGDTPLCLDCQTADDPALVCETHQRTHDGECPLDHYAPGWPAAGTATDDEGNVVSYT